VPPTTLVLWDVDHTLMDSGGVGGEVYASAFEKVTGRPLEQMADVFGRTEPVIFRDTLQANGIEDSEDLFDRFAQEQARGYAERAAEMHQRGRALPGAAEALRALSGRDDVIQSVLTGNTRPSAEIKLRIFGLDRYLDLDSGAYGTDNDIRARLVDIARQRAAQRTGHHFDQATTVLIGDTPGDITAARDGAARIIAVATGRDSPEVLGAAGADTVLVDLTNTAGLLAVIYPDEPPQWHSD
jgi:phosphoglycolate phosphatase